MRKTCSKLFTLFIFFAALAFSGCEQSVSTGENNTPVAQGGDGQNSGSQNPENQILDYGIVYNNTHGFANPNPSHYSEKEEIVLSDLKSTDDMHFLGWYNDVPDETGKYSLIKKIPVGSTCDYSLHAKWRYKIVYENTSGIEIHNPEYFDGAYYDGEEEDLELLDLPVDSNSRFVGWYDDFEDGNKIERISATNNAPLTLYARVWESNAYTVEELLQALDDGTAKDSVIVRGEVKNSYIDYTSSPLYKISRKMIEKKYNLSLDLHYVSGLKEITTAAFFNNYYLKQIKLPDTIIKIGIEAFCNCTGLTSIEIPKNVTEIDVFAFMGCNGLSSVKMPANVKKIGAGAFSQCNKLSEIEIPSSITSIEVGTFQLSGLKNVKIPLGVTNIGYGAFSQCYELTGIEIPETVTSIGNSAFGCCTKLAAVEIPASVTYIGRAAFVSCNKLNSVSFDDTVNVWYARKSSSNTDEGIAVNDDKNTLEKVGTFSSTDTAENATKLKTTYWEYNLCNDLYFQ